MQLCNLKILLVFEGFILYLVYFNFVEEARECTNKEITR